MTMRLEAWLFALSVSLAIWAAVIGAGWWALGASEEPQQVQTAQAVQWEHGE